ncbi:nucleotide disphospho-sugar-binding domain-containing protein [Streptomyces angustmyceticus]|uniref:nucleotide disphospho-sugar-binding domain-containing protein n=1 Tax=Streptomyces angustmyceticus TaxID=285578 RepID=UPI00382C5587
MRVLIVVWPLTAHLYPTLPVAWALQGAGHEVRVASHPDLTGTITAAGLPAVPLGTPETIASPATVGEHLLPAGHRDRLATALGIDQDTDTDVWATVSTYTLASSRVFHPADGSAAHGWGGVDDLVAAARDWRPDLVLWDPNWPAAAVAARACGAAHGRVLWGRDYLGWACHRIDRRRAELAAAGLPDPVAEIVRPAAARHGVPVDDDLLLGQFTLDPTPADMRLPSRARTVPVRRIPYTGAAAVPSWLGARPGRPRVALTLGATQRMFDNDKVLVPSLLEMVDGLDIEVIATLDTSQLAGQRLPDNVRAVDYLPLNLLLPSCSAIIHHGGIGTFTAAVAHRVPQLVVGDELRVAYAANSAYAVRHGAGLAVDPQQQSVAEMRARFLRVLSEPSFQEGTRRLHADWLAMPSPNDTVPVLEKLTALHRTAR